MQGRGVTRGGGTARGGGECTRGQQEGPAEKRQRRRRAGAGGANGVSWQHGGWQRRQQEVGSGTGDEEEEDLWEKQVDTFSGKVTLVTRPSVWAAFLFPPFSQPWISNLTVLSSHLLYS